MKSKATPKEAAKIAGRERIIDENPVLSMMRETGNTQNARLTIIVSHGVTEILVNTLIQHYCKNGSRIIDDTRTYPHSAKLLILHEKEVLDDQTYNDLNSFRKLRNEAAHGGTFVFKPVLLNEFLRYFTESEKKLSNYERVRRLCNYIVINVWLLYEEEVFRLYFKK